MMPLVLSIIIPTYNRAALVKRAVESVLSQHGTDFEVIVIDDGSTDSTAVTLAEFGNQIRVINQTNQGVAAARNLGVQLAYGKYIWFLDSDDYLLPGAYEAMHEAIAKNGSADVFYGWARSVDHTGHRAQWNRPQAEGRVWRHYLFSNPTLPGTYVISGEKLRAVTFDSSLPVYEDWDVLLRLSFICNFVCIAHLLVEVEFQPVQRSNSTQPFAIQQSARQIYDRILADTISRPLVLPVQRYLEANTYVMLGHHYRVYLGDSLAARRAFTNAIRIAPTFRRAYMGLFQSFLSASYTRRFRNWRAAWFRLMDRRDHP